MGLGAALPSRGTNKSGTVPRAKDSEPIRAKQCYNGTTAGVSYGLRLSTTTPCSKRSAETGRHSFCAVKVYLRTDELYVAQQAEVLQKTMARDRNAKLHISQQAKRDREIKRAKDRENQSYISAAKPSAIRPVTSCKRSSSAAS